MHSSVGASGPPVALRQQIQEATVEIYFTYRRATGELPEALIFSTGKYYISTGALPESFRNPINLRQKIQEATVEIYLPTGELPEPLIFLPESYRNFINFRQKYGNSRQIFCSYRRGTGLLSIFYRNPIYFYNFSQSSYY